jgi:hypothetical protein
LKFGKVPGRNRSVEKKFKLGTRKYEEYKGVFFGDGDFDLVVDVWFHRVDEEFRPQRSDTTTTRDGDA